MNTTETGKEFVEHYGTKGMKWGVRRAAKKAAKADKKWQSNIYSVRGAIAVHNKTADIVNSKIDGLNARHPKGHLDFPNRPETKAYIRAYERLVESSTKQAVDSVHGISPSGALRARVDLSDKSQPHIVVESTEARHADDVLPTLVFDLDISDNGHISLLSLVKEDLEQSAAIGSDFVEHYGVPGMKWGVRKSVSRRRSASAKRSSERSVKDMSDDELRAVLNRMDMERRYNSLTGGGKKSGAGALAATGAAFLVGIGSNVLRTQVQNAANAKVGAALAKATAKKVSGN